MTYQELADEWQSGDMIACHTSGSTGAPKRIDISKKFMLESAIRTADFFNLTSDSLLYSCISPDFIGGKMMFVRQQLLNCRLKWETPSNRPLNGITDRISLLSVVPSQMHHILDNIDKLPVIDNILIGGSAIPAALRKRIAQSGLNVYESYGMTETASHIAVRKIEMQSKPFHTLGNITVEYSGEVLKINIPGWKPVVTNDCAEIISSEEFYITGRRDNIIISGGCKINPEGIEEELSKYFDFPFYITSGPDDIWGQKVIMVIEGLPDDIDGSINFFKSAFEICLKKYEKPKEIYYMENFRRTPSGKIIRDLPDKKFTLFRSV